MRCLAMIVLALSGLLAVPQGSAAAEPVSRQERGVKVRPADSELVERRPREIATFTFRVTNFSDRRLQFLEEVSLPEGWRRINQGFPFELNAGESLTRLLSFLVPSRALAGRYEISYRVHSRKFPAISDAFQVHVLVPAVSGLEARLLKAPAYAIAGDEYAAVFVVINQSNQANEFKVEVQSGADFPCGLDVDTFRLAPRESRQVTVRVRTDPKVKQAFHHTLAFNARLGEAEEPKSQARSAVEIIPGAPAAEDPFHRLPLRLTLRPLGSRNGGTKAGFRPSSAERARWMKRAGAT